jgi:hypothetical protein
VLKPRFRIGSIRRRHGSIPKGQAKPRGFF